MSDRDPFAELEALWQAGDPADSQQAVEQLGEDAVRRVRRVQAVEAATSAALALGIAGAMLLRPTAAVLTSGGLILLALVWSTWARHRLSDQALLLRSKGGRDYAAREAEAKGAELRRARLGLLLILPTVVGGLMLADAFLRGRTLAASFKAIPDMVDGPLGVVAGAMVLLVLVRTYFEQRRLRAELNALEAVQQDFLKEEAYALEAAELLRSGNGFPVT